MLSFFHMDLSPIISKCYGPEINQVYYEAEMNKSLEIKSIKVLVFTLYENVSVAACGYNDFTRVFGLTQQKSKAS